MQIADLVSQLEAARNAVVHLHTRLTVATKQHQAAASLQIQRVQQLEVQQAALNKRLDSMTITISSSQDKNATAICNMRSSTSHFLTELITVVGQQFGKLQADLKQNQANEIKAEVEKAVNETCSTEAGSSLLEQLVQRAVAHCMTQQLDRQISRGIDNTALTSRDRMPSDTHIGKGNGYNNTKTGGQDAGSPDQMGGQAGYPKQIVFAEACDPGSKQDAAVGEGTAEVLSPIAAGRLPVIRSQDSLSLMHHASAAGARTPTPSKLDSFRQRSGGQSPAESRQALAEIDLNQPFEVSQTGLWPPAIAQQRQQAVEQQRQQRERQEKQLGPQPMLQQCTAVGLQHRRDAGSRQNKQLRWADTCRQLDQQLLQGSQPPANGSQNDAPSENVLPNSADLGSDRMSGQVSDGNATMNQAQSRHAEELQMLAQLPQSSRTAQPPQLQSLAYTRTAQDVTPRTGWKVSQGCDAHHDSGSAANRSSTANHMPRQCISERLDRMQPSHAVPGLAVANFCSSGWQQDAMQQPCAAQGDCGLAVTGSLRCQPGLHDVEDSDLPAGIPLTPIPVQQPQPRDSLEASIWKLSGGRRQHSESVC